MENITSSSISDLISPEVDTIAPDETVMTARRRMESQTSRSLIVVDGTRPIGVVQWRGLTQQDGSTPVSSVMHTDFPVLRADMSVEEVRQHLASTDVDFDHLPVVDGSGMLIGEVPRGAITKREVATNDATQPIVSGPDAGTSEGPAVHLERGMKVTGSRGKKLGTVDEVDINTEGHIAHFTVKHGLLSKKTKRLPADVIRTYSGDEVVLSIDEMEFKMLADLDDEPA